MSNDLKNSFLSSAKKSTFLLNLFAGCFSFATKFRTKGNRNNKIIYTGSLLSRTKIHIKGEDNSILIAPKNRLSDCKLNITGKNCKIVIESNCTLKKLELWLEDDGSEIFIGHTTSIEGGHIASTEGESIKIGSDCMFSHRIEIRNGDSHSIFAEGTKIRINPAKPVIVGNHVWLGADAKVLKGSVVNDGAVIATGAIVTGVVEPHSIYAGNPAKKIKDDIHWDRERV